MEQSECHIDWTKKNEKKDPTRPMIRAGLIGSGVLQDSALGDGSGFGRVSADVGQRDGERFAVLGFYPKVGQAEKHFNRQDGAGQNQATGYR